MNRRWVEINNFQGYFEIPIVIKNMWREKLV